jgi:hypothetical protein
MSRVLTRTKSLKPYPVVTTTLTADNSYHELVNVSGPGFLNRALLGWKIAGSLISSLTGWLKITIDGTVYLEQDNTAISSGSKSAFLSISDATYDNIYDTNILGFDTSSTQYFGFSPIPFYSSLKVEYKFSSPDTLARAVCLYSKYF